jgi:predicted small lipoprotein YifL
MKRGLTLMAMLAAVAALSACGDKPQTLQSAAKVDSQAFQGTGMPYSVQGWKQGDKASWEQQVKNRTQQTQNEYTKVN